MTSYVLTFRAVKGSNLTASEFDANTHNLDDRATALEGTVSGLSDIESAYIDTGNHLHLVKASSEDIDAGELPVAGTFNDLFKGEWQPLTTYSENDLFTYLGRLGAVLYDHTSASTFAWGANDGGGHDYYRVIIDYTSVSGREISDTTYSPTPDDVGIYLRFTGASCAVTIDPDQNWPDWAELHLRDETTGGVTIDITSSTALPAAINSQYNCTNNSAGQGSSIGMKKVGATDDWDIWGHLAAS